MFYSFNSEHPKVQKFKKKHSSTKISVSEPLATTVYMHCSMPRATSQQESSRDTVKPHISKEDRICSKTRSRETIEHENALSGDLAMSLNRHHIRITKSMMTAQGTMATVKTQS
tara:strand:- start:626 stop:967 length:342 start_codon:yes stop_codon:yes gene_type:complete